MKNNKGFTLVELIVVAAILSILMGAILNFIQPINQFYTNTWATTDANDIGNTVVDYLDKELRYTTNMLILEDYEGLPVVEDGCVISDSGAKSSTKFTDVIILDNVNVRGSSLADFDPTSTAARRKNARGALIKESLADGTLDIDKSKIVLGEAEYSDFKAEFTATLAQGTKNKCLQIGIKESKPKYSGGTWTYDKVAYDQTRSIELVNINQIGFPMQVNYYTNRTDKDGNLLGEALDYSRFAQADAPGGLTTGQESYYNVNKKYTYIFYTKSVPSSSAKCTIKIYNKEVGGSQLNSFRVNTGGTITDAQYQNARSLFPDKTEVTGEVYTVYTLNDLICHETRKYLSEYKTEAITQDMIFYPDYSGSNSVSPKGYVKFYDYYDDLGNYSATPFLKYTCAYYDPLNPVIPGLPNYISSVPDGLGDADHIFKRWETPSGFVFYGESTTFSSGDWSFYAVYEERQKYHVKFVDADGNELSDTEYPEGISNSTNIAKPADPTPPSGKNFLGWFLNGDKTQIAFDSLSWTLTGDMTFKPVFEDIPASGAVLSVSSIHTDNFNWGRSVAFLTIKVKNVGTENSSGSSKLVIHMNDYVDSVSSYWGGINPSSVTSAIKDITVNFSRVLAPNEEADLNMYVYATNTGNYSFAIDTVDAHNT